MQDIIQPIQDILAEKLPDDLVQPRHTDNAHFYEYMPNGEVYASVTTKSGILAAPYLKQWAVKVALDHYVGSQLKNYDESAEEPNRIFKEAGEVGTRGHEAIENYINDMIAGTPSGVVQYLKGEKDTRVISTANAGERYIHESGMIPIVSEKLVASPKYKYAGTLDCLAMVPRQLAPGIIECEKHTYGRSVSKIKVNDRICMYCNQRVRFELSIVDWKTSNVVEGSTSYSAQVAAYAEALKELTGLKAKRLYIVQLNKERPTYNVFEVKERAKAFRLFKHLANAYDLLQVEGLAPENMKKKKVVCL